jgi:hypothetical protein
MRIPMLQVKDPVTKTVVMEAVDNTAKGQLFYKTFFPPEDPTLTAPQMTTGTHHHAGNSKTSLMNKSIEQYER